MSSERNRCRGARQRHLVGTEEAAQVLDHSRVAPLLVELPTEAREDRRGRELRLEDRGAGLQHAVAQRQPVVIGEQREEPRQRLRRGDPPQRVHRRLREHLVGNRVEQRLHGARIADLAQGSDGGELQPEIGVQQPDQPGHRFARFQRSERLDRRLRDVGVAVLEQR